MYIENLPKLGCVSAGQIQRNLERGTHFRVHSLAVASYLARSVL